MMSKAKMLFWVNALLVLSALLQALTGLGLLVDVKIGEEIHEINGPVFVALAVAHVLLNWSWVKANFLRGLGTR